MSRPFRPDAFGCPSCEHTVTVSRHDPDAAVDAMFTHVQEHTGWDKAASYGLLARLRPLVIREVA